MGRDSFESEPGSDFSGAVRRIFLRACEVPADERPALVARLAAGDGRLANEVLSLLSHDSERTGEDFAIAARTMLDALDSVDPLQLNGFRLLRRLGEGGMGQVWLAEQQRPVRRRVAIKVIRGGLGDRQVLARFQAERQALAMMDHPNIATIHDAGRTAAGRPYFVMEYVEGVPIGEFCDRERASVAQRIELLIQVCDGVQHAHQKAIIHRDLKPTNVLVTRIDGRPVVKVIDFGLAKAVERRLTDESLHTRAGVPVGTPDYMSPEQADAQSDQVDTRTDVYSLGVLLYELLVGALPFDSRELRAAGFDEMRRRIREDTPPTPSARIATLGESRNTIAERRATSPATWMKSCRGDLDWITMKAMEKDRNRRYGTASELAADLRRFLDDEPVVAGPPSAGYRLRKFARRHKLGVGLAAAAVATLTAFAGTMGVQAKRIALERDAAERAKTDLESVVEFQAWMLSSIDPQGMGARLLRGMSDQISERQRLRGGSEEDVAETMASLDELVADVNATDLVLDLLDRDILGRAADTLEERFADRPEIDARLRGSIGGTYVRLGRLQRAEPHFVKKLEISRREFGENDPRTLMAMNALGLFYARVGRTDSAKPLLRAALDGLQRALGPDHPNTLVAMNNMANLLQSEGRYEDAASMHRRTLDARVRVLGEEHPLTLKSMSNLANFYAGQARYGEAERLYRRAIEVQERVLGKDDPDTLISMNNLANVLWSQGKSDEAESLRVSILDVQRRVLGEDHPETLRSKYNLALSYVETSRLEQAEALYAPSLEARRRVLGPEHRHTLMHAHELAVVYFRQGRYEEAESLLVQTLEAQLRVDGERSRQALLTMESLAELYATVGRVDDARPLTERALAGRKDRGEQGNTKDLDSYARLALTCKPEDLRDPATALTFAVAANEASRYEDPYFLDTLALAYHETGESARAIETQTLALSFLPDGAVDRAEFEERLVRYGSSRSAEE